NPVTVIGESDCRDWWRIDRAGASRYVNKGPANNLHIRWTQPGGGGGTGTPVTITWRGNGGTSPPPSSLISGNNFGTLPASTRTGRVQVGWFTTTANTGGTRIFSDSSVPNAGRDYHARWNEPSRHQDSWHINTTVPLQFLNNTSTGQGGDWRPYMRRAMTNWNNAMSGSGSTVRFVEAPLSVTPPMHNWVRRDNFTWDCYAQVTLFSFDPNSTGAVIVGFDISMNRRTIGASTGWRPDAVPNWVSSVFGHELGHVLGLEDDPIRNTPNNSIMNTNRQRHLDQMTRPQPFDVTSVRILYDR
ncbi:MAG: hypothetical protein FWE08_09005, partial [Oscillospiraceae bacterium]|nr:hypothetical protein [Oscillospiraceae bacterium]